MINTHAHSPTFFVQVEGILVLTSHADRISNAKYVQADVRLARGI